MNKKIKNPFLSRYVVCLPSTLDLDYELLKNPITLKRLANNPTAIRDRLAYLLGQIFSAIDKKSTETPKNEWKPLHSRFLQKVVSNYAQYLSYAIEAKIIETDGYWSNNKDTQSSKSYRFTKRICRKGFELKKYVIYDKTIVKNASRYSRDKSPKLNDYATLTKAFEACDVEMEEFETDATDCSNKFHMNRESLLRIKQAELSRFSVGTTNRLYTPFSNLAKNLRRYVTINGRGINEIDIINSVPNMSLLLFEPERIYHNEHLKNLLTISNHNIDITILYRYIYGIKGRGRMFHVMLRKNRQFVTKKKDITRYKEMVLDGSLYEYLAKVWNHDERVKTTYDRKKAKDKILTIFNSPNRHRNPEKEVFRELFPSVIDVIHYVNKGYTKTKNGKGRNKKRDYDITCPFAKFTQSVEAYLVLELVAMSLMNENPDLKLITLHDAIYATSEHINLVNEKLATESTKLLGTPVKAKITNVVTGEVINNSVPQNV